MNAAELINRLNAYGITLAITDNAQSLNVTGPLESGTREVIRLHKAELITALACHIIEYELANLCGQMPPCYQMGPAGQVIAYYRTEAEFKEHITRVLTARGRFDATTDLISAALALGGEIVPEQGPEDEIPF